MKRAVILAAAMAFSSGIYAQNAAVVNGVGIPSSKVEQIVKALKDQGQQDSPQLREQIRQELIGRQVFIQEAERRGLPKDAEVKAAMDAARETVLMNALFAQYTKQNPITEAQIKAEYDKAKVAQGTTEYMARHILVPTEADAKDLIAKIKAGANFADLAKQYSKDNATAVNGGDLGWISPAALVPEFSQVLIRMNKGELSAVPVKTQFGWHVVELQDTRPLTFPALDDIRQQVEQAIRQNQLRTFQEELRAKAKIQ